MSLRNIVTSPGEPIGLPTVEITADCVTATDMPLGCSVSTSKLHAAEVTISDRTVELEHVVTEADPYPE